MRLVPLLVLALSLFCGTARATEPPVAPLPSAEPSSPEPIQARDLDVTIAGVFGEHSFRSGGFTEIVVGIGNRGKELGRGTVVAKSYRPWRGHGFQSIDAPFEVAPGADAVLVVPTFVSEFGEPLVEVRAEDDALIGERTLDRHDIGQAALIELTPRSPLGAMLAGVSLGVTRDPWQGRYRATGEDLRLEVASVSTVTRSGEPVLPRRAASYSVGAVVLVRSDLLVRLGAAELAALVGWTLSGGSLAVAVTRPEDLRHPTIAALVGGESLEVPVEGATLARVPLSPLAPGSGAKTFGPDVSPTTALVEKLRGFRGGNLLPSAFGSTATYGLGEVHLLAADPTTAPALGDEWMHLRLAKLVERAVDRRVSILTNLGRDADQDDDVRRYLDPNEGSRWAVVVAVLLLCVYALVAGPVNFAHWRRRGRPLQALPMLAVLSGGVFLAVAVLAVFAKGVTARARHLTLVEAGGGMSTGATRRFRGFYVPRVRSLPVQAGHSAAVVIMNSGPATERNDRWHHDRDVHRLSGVPLRPWQTQVVREDGFAELGGGVALVKGPGEDLTVVNRSGRGLLGLLVHRPGKPTGWLARLESGGRARHSDLEPLAVRWPQSWNGVSFGEFDVGTVGETLDQRIAGLGEAWTALATAPQFYTDWFPADAPVLLAQLEGGEGASRDSGLTLEHDRTLVRIVGYGGEP